MMPDIMMRLPCTSLRYFDRGTGLLSTASFAGAIFHHFAADAAPERTPSPPVARLIGCRIPLGLASCHRRHARSPAANSPCHVIAGFGHYFTRTSRQRRHAAIPVPRASPLLIMPPPAAFLAGHWPVDHFSPDDAAMPRHARSTGMTRRA